MVDLVTSTSTPHLYAMGAGVSTISGTVGEGRLDRALAEAVPDLSRARIRALVEEERLRIGGAVVTDLSSKKFTGRDFTLDIPAPRASDNAAQDIELVIAHEDDDLIVIDKPAGLVVHPAAGHADGTLVNALLHHCAGQLSGIGGVERPGIVHRIDRDTSGLMIAAKSDRAHEGLARQFADHSIERRYLAIVNGIPMPRDGRIETHLGRSDRDRKKMAVVGPTRGKHAVTHYRTLSPLDRAALVECRLETGRTHQVRVHMAHIGHALVGDPVYGRGRNKSDYGPARKSFPRQALHAAMLGFIHPVSAEHLRFESALPADMQELFSELAV